jgi:hypothetical protein
MMCETCALLIPYSGRTGDLSASDQAALTAHIAGCPACDSMAARYSAGDAAIMQAMRAVAAPTGLRDALQTQAIGVQAALWRARWGARLATATAACVAIMLAGSLYSTAKRNLNTLDSEAVLADFEQRGAWSLNFDDWRSVEGLPALPIEIDPQLITFTGRLPLAGTLAPCARLSAGPGFDAAIYYVRARDFNTANLADAIGSQGSVRIFREGSWTIVVVHTGHTLQPFLRKPGAAA